uniref:TAP binding protein like n=1 Tax=Neogobius melanostomus TaxID=47308 RepID=A0A8C6WHM0_9GOBI
MFLVILFGFSVMRVYGDEAAGVADLVLSCVLVEDGAAHGGTGGGGGGGGFSRTPATLVLKDVSVGPDQSLEMLTPFIPASEPDPELVLIEATVSKPDIPNSDVLLHADCNGQEVTCEMSRYSPNDALKNPDQAFFMVSLHIEGVDFSTSLILQTVKVEQPAQRHIQLGLPLSQSGTVQTEVIMVVHSDVRSVTAPLKGDVLVPCGFKQQDSPLAPDVHIEWRVQHRGKGRKVFEMKTPLEDAEGKAEILAERSDSSVSAEGVVSEGNASLSMSRLKVADEGTYICTVTIGQFHAQQVIQLNVIQLPEVSLSDYRLALKSDTTLSCHSSKFYPLDAQIEWYSRGPEDTERVVFSGKASLSGHRRHGDGTFSLSSHLTVPHTIAPGTEITCVVSHPALDTPHSETATVKSPEPDSYWWVLGFLIITVLFFLQVMK